MESNIVLGIDIGGSHITARLVDLQTGSHFKSSEIREAVNSKGTADEIISLWSTVIDNAFSTQNIDVKKIGIAMPGPFDYVQGVAWMKNQDKYDALYGLNVKEHLAERLGIPAQNIRFLNDAESFLKGEVFCGAAKGTSRALGLTLGTGLGSARYGNGVVEDADLWCSPFLEGMAEDYLSTRWFVGRYFVLTGEKISGVKELAALGAKEDTAALQVFKEFGKNLSLFLSGIVIKDQPETIVIGGNIANAFELFAEEVEKQLSALPFAPAIQKSALGEEASLVGAASCWAEPETVGMETQRA